MISLDELSGSTCASPASVATKSYPTIPAKPLAGHPYPTVAHSPFPSLAPSLAPLLFCCVDRPGLRNTGSLRPGKSLGNVPDRAPEGDHEGCSPPSDNSNCHYSNMPKHPHFSTFRSIGSTRSTEPVPPVHSVQSNPFNRSNLFNRIRSEGVRSVVRSTLFSPGAPVYRSLGLSRMQCR